MRPVCRGRRPCVPSILGKSGPSYPFAGRDDKRKGCEEVNQQARGLDDEAQPVQAVER